MLNSAITLSADKATRQKWCPERIESVMSALAEHFQKQEVAKVVNPAVLMKISAEASAFFAAALSGNNRSAWAETRFPGSEEDATGFPAFVAELNNRLAESGIEVKNAKRLVVSHPWNQLSIISSISDLYYEGELQRDEAINWLKEEGQRCFPPKGILMSEGQLDFYFGNKTDSRTCQQIESDAVELHKQVKAIQKYLQIDLSDLDCVRGLLFESLVGVILSGIYGSDQVEAQRQLPLSYLDLDGVPHRSVRLDFYVHGQDEPVFEVKLRNSWQNIITSVMAQSEAVRVSNELEDAPKVNVIYRSPCGEMHAALNYNMKLNEEAELMRLTKANKPIQDLLKYVSVEELLAQVPDARLATELRKLLRVVDNLLASENVSLIKEATQSLEQIRRSGQHPSMNVGIFNHYYASGREHSENFLSKRQIEALFGEELSNPWPKAPEVTERVTEMQRYAQRSRERILKRIAALESGAECRVLSPEIIASLRAMPASKFSELTLSVFANIEEERKSRLLDQKSRQCKRNGSLLKRVEVLNVRSNSSLVDRSQAVFEKHLPALTDINNRGLLLNKQINKIWEISSTTLALSSADIRRVISTLLPPKSRHRASQISDDILKRLPEIQEDIFHLVEDFGKIADFTNSIGRDPAEQKQLLINVFESMQEEIAENRRRRTELIDHAAFKSVLSRISEILRRSDGSFSPAARKELRLLELIVSTKAIALQEDALEVVYDYCRDLLEVSIVAVGAVMERGGHILDLHAEDFKPDVVRMFCCIIGGRAMDISAHYKSSLQTEGGMLTHLRDGLSGTPEYVVKVALENFIAGSNSLFTSFTHQVVVNKEVEAVVKKEVESLVSNLDTIQADVFSRIETGYPKILAAYDVDSVVSAIESARRAAHQESLRWIEIESLIMMNLCGKSGILDLDQKKLATIASNPEVISRFSDTVTPAYRLYFDVIARKLFQAEILAYSEARESKEYALWFLKENIIPCDLCSLPQDERIALLLDVAKNNDEMFNALMAS